MFLNKRQQIPQPRREGPAGRGIPSSLTRKPPSFERNVPNKNAGPQKESAKPLDWDDISLSSEDSKSFERFLKKNPSDDGVKKEKQSSKKKEKPSTAVSFERPKTSRGVSEAIPKPTISSSSALNRLALLEERIKNRQDVHSQNKVSLSGSDFDIDVSSDMEIKREMGKPNISLREKLEQITMLKDTKKGKKIFLTFDNDSESSQEDTAARKSFLKNDDAHEHSDDSDSQESSDKDIMKKNQKIMKVHGSTDFDESEVSLQTYLKSFEQGKGSKKSSSSKKVTFASDLVRSSDLEQSLDDFMPPSDKSDEPSSFDEVIPSKIHNIMSLDDLMPSQELKLDDEDEKRPTSALGFVGLQSVDDLLPAGSDVRSSSEYVPSMSEEIQEASDRYSEQSFSDGPVNVLQNLRSIDDLQETNARPELKITSTPVKTAPEAINIFKAQATVESESEEIKSESQNYTEDFHSDDDTLKETESITKDVSEASPSISSALEEDSRRSKDHSASYSSSPRSSISSSSTSTVTTRTPSPVQRRRKKKVETAQVQTDIAAGAWLPGSVYADTTSFKPSRLIDNEALDVLTSYNPANLAIQDLLQQQVTLTREFVARSRRLHDLAVSAVPCDYVYGEINQEGLERLKRIWFNDEKSAVSIP